MKALKIIGITLLILVALFFVVAIFLPSKMHVEESMVINKPASLIYEQVNNFKNWPAWSPWQAHDTAMTSTYEGPEEGVDAKTVWTSKKNGSGSMIIIESKPYEKIVSSLDFGQKGPATNYFEFADEQGGTKVTWGVDIARLSYPEERYYGLLMPGMLKTYMKEGLAKLKEITEAMPDPPNLTIVELPERKVISVVDSCDWSDMGQKMEQMFGELYGMQHSGKCQFTGAPFTIYHKWDEDTQFSVFENCIPVDHEVANKGRVQYKVIPATRAVKGEYFGPYDQMYGMYVALDHYVKDFSLEESGGPIEEYITDPTQEPDTSKWQTNIYFPVR